MVGALANFSVAVSFSDSFLEFEWWLTGSILQLFVSRTVLGVYFDVFDLLFSTLISLWKPSGSSFSFLPRSMLPLWPSPTAFPSALKSLTWLAAFPTSIFGFTSLNKSIYPIVFFLGLVWNPKDASRAGAAALVSSRKWSRSLSLIILFELRLRLFESLESGEFCEQSFSGERRWVAGEKGALLLLQENEEYFVFGGATSSVGDSCCVFFCWSRFKFPIYSVMSLFNLKSEDCGSSICFKF